MLLYKSILISSIYVAPTAKIDMNIFQELYNINNNYIIAGDLNATLSEMGSIKTNARGKQLQVLLKEGLIECVDDDSTTFEKNDYEAKLDWILRSQPLTSFITNVKTHPTIGTINGHKPLTFDIQIGTEPKPTSPRLSFNFKAAKWTKFKTKLDQQLILWNNDLSLNSPLDIEDYSMFITNSIMLATQEVVPTSTPTRKSYTLKLLIQHLTKLFNQILKQGYIPTKWKTANIILIMKPKKDKKHPYSYRPISLLSCLGKLLEKIIKQRLMVELERRHILPEHQNRLLCARRHSAVILFDIKAAFDSVWHDTLIYKLNDFRLPKYIINYLTSFLNNQTASIEIENVLSRQFNLKIGTPQGSPLSPLLYIIYTPDSKNEIPTHTEHGLFADDTALWKSSNTMTYLSSRLQKSVDAFESWCKSWKLKLQPTKTEMIHFTIHPRKKFKHQVEVKVDNTIIKPLDHTRYLDVIIDKRLNWRRHLDHIETKIAPRIGLLRYLSRTAYEPNIRTMINIFKSRARTIIIYGYPVLLTADQYVRNRLQIIQNKALRAALGLLIYTSVDYIHKIINSPKITDYATTLLKQPIQIATANNGIALKKYLQDILERIS
ncbi:unnamed protein product [Rotaria magnacalcarata]|uniref:Reverse transcriptase domain-containing protein n=4 Tax=Rotaria magnacalcarata TaxID=392030 RepID=A0A814SNK4_9BILA|nr:unnamed protein product [Rotaria magnacalcarata]CAF3906557.1 unnamed protein product [Rotaria magnacalcarata]CAF4061974.1 unnamed protein product [Rotaria magnacalcarata]